MDSDPTAALLSEATSLLETLKAIKAIEIKQAVVVMGQEAHQGEWVLLDGGLLTHCGRISDTVQALRASEVGVASRGGNDHTAQHLGAEGLQD